MNLSAVNHASIKALAQQELHRARPEPGGGKPCCGQDEVNFSAEARFLGGQVQQGPSPFKGLAEALSSGQLSDAQAAFDAIEASLQARHADGPKAHGRPHLRFEDDFSILGDALDAGDLEGARNAFDTLLKSLPSANPRTVTHESRNGVHSSLDAGDLEGVRNGFETLVKSLPSANPRTVTHESRNGVFSSGREG